MNEKKRITMVFPSKLHEYARTMAQVAGLSINDFMVSVLTQHMKQYEDQYKQVLSIRQELSTQNIEE